MKWLIGCLLALCMISSAFAGEDPYVAIVGNDILANSFYISPKQAQFLYDQTIFGIPTTGELFRSQSAAIQPEICDINGKGSGSLGIAPPFTFLGLPNARVTAGNAGIYEWFIRLPKKPSGEINLVFECGVLKPNAFTDKGFAAVEECAAETGERIGFGFCARQPIDPGVGPVVAAALPRVTAIALPGPYNSFTPFYLTAYRNPGTYAINFGDGAAIPNDGVNQLLDGSTGARVLLKSCMDKVVVAKLPVAGQVNAGAPTPPITTAITNVEADLVDGDLIYVRLTVPRQNTVDIYCNSQSLRLDGVGEAPF
jgi:hypothetical protein